MKSIAQQFSERSNLINSSEIRKVFDLASGKKDPINFSIGQPDFPLPGPVKEAIKKALDNNLTGYTPTQGIYSLRERLVRKLHEENKILGFEHPALDAENILVAPGVSAILYLLFAILINPGDEIILIDPYFLIYEALGQFFRAKIHFIPEDQIIEGLKKTVNPRVKFILFSSPSNPSGKIIPKETLLEMSEILRRHAILAIADEIYEKFDYEKTHASLGAFYENTITLNGFSKSYAMTGLRLGYACAPREVINKMATIQQYTFVCAPHPAQVGGEAALDVDISSHIADYKKRRDLIFGLLKDEFDVKKPDGAFYIFPELKRQKNKIPEFAQSAIAENVLIVPGHIFSKKPGSFRISFASSHEKLEKGAEILLDLVRRKSL